MLILCIFYVCVEAFGRRDPKILGVPKCSQSFTAAETEAPFFDKYCFSFIWIKRRCHICMLFCKILQQGLTSSTHISLSDTTQDWSQFNGQAHAALMGLFGLWSAGAVQLHPGK